MGQLGHNVGLGGDRLLQNLLEPSWSEHTGMVVHQLIQFSLNIAVHVVCLHHRMT